MDLRAQLDRLIPAHMRDGDPEEAERARMMMAIALCSVPLYALFTYEALVDYRLALSAIVIICGGLMSLSAPLVLRQTGSVLFLTNYLSIALFATTGIYSWQRGGFVPTVLSWNLTIVALALIQRSQRFLLSWTLVMLVEINGLYLLQRMGIPGTKLQLGHGYAGLLGSLLAIALVSFYLEHSRQRIEAEQERLREQLMHEQRLDSLGRMAGGVAHDFNNLLSAVKLHASLALREIDEQHKARGDVQTILDAAKHGSALTAQLLAFGRRDAVKTEVLDVGEVVGEMQKLLTGMVDEDIELTVEWQEGLPNVSIDRGQLEQVVMNLVVNSCDAMSEPGELRVAVRDHTLLRAATSYGMDVPAGRYVAIEVSDDGVGIDSEALPLLFDPFYTSKPPGKGTGLGLATVHGVVSRAGGLVRVRSARGKGSTFEVLLPAAKESIRPPRASLLGEPGETATVLLVEDEPSARAAMHRILRFHGRTTLTAEDSESALALSRQHDGPIDVLLTDVQLPGRDGVELADAIRDERPDIRVVYMSGACDHEQVRLQIDERRATFLQKPIDTDRLLTKV